VVFGVMWGGLFIAAAITGIRISSVRPLAALLFGILVVWIGWLSAFLLELKGGIVRYRTLFGGAQLRVQDIASMRIETGISKRYSDRFKLQGLVRLIIDPVRTLHSRPIVVNATVLGYDRVVAFASEIQTQAGRRLLD
jgi:hypothetical protein